MMEQALSQAELDWRFLSFEVSESELALALTGLQVLGFRGVMLAGVFRDPASDLAARLTPRARLSGSVNCLTLEGGQLMGDDTYGAAFVEALATSQTIAESSLLLIGGGHQARSIAVASAEAGVSALHLAGADETSLEQLSELAAEASRGETSDESVGDSSGDSARESNHELVIETHAIGKTLEIPAGTTAVVFAPADLDSQVPQLKLGDPNANLTLVDTRLASSRTDFLKQGAEQNATLIEGADLLARETALILERWTGLQFDRSPLREAAEEYLGV